MEELDKSSLKKLSTKERVKKLKQLEDERKSEVNEIEALIKDSMKELKIDEVASEITPEPRDVDIGRLFESEGTQLEKTVREESKGEEEPLRYLSVKQAYEDYRQLQDISYASMMGVANQSQMESLDKIGERLDKVKYISASAEAANILVASRAALHKIKKYAGLD